MKKILLIVLLIAVLTGGWFGYQALFNKTYKTVQLDCVTPNSWNVPLEYPANLDVPDYFQPLINDLYCIGYRDDKGDWFYLLIQNNPENKGLCQEEVIAAESDVKGLKRFWIYENDIPKEITFEQYKDALNKLFDESWARVPDEQKAIPKKEEEAEEDFGLKTL